jgi:hypothetical protein
VASSTATIAIPCLDFRLLHLHEPHLLSVLAKDHPTGWYTHLIQPSMASTTASIAIPCLDFRLLHLHEPHLLSVLAKDYPVRWYTQLVQSSMASATTWIAIPCLDFRLLHLHESHLLRFWSKIILRDDTHSWSSLQWPPLPPESPFPALTRVFFTFTNLTSLRYEFT